MPSLCMSTQILVIKIKLSNAINNSLIAIDKSNEMKDQDGKQYRYGLWM